MELVILVLALLAALLVIVLLAIAGAISASREMGIGAHDFADILNVALKGFLGRGRD